VVVGGEQIATETGMHLAETGHSLTLLTADSQLAPDADFVHLSRERRDMDKFKTFSYVTGAAVKMISGGRVVYTDAGGGEKSIPADTVVFLAGREPRLDEAIGFYGAAGRFFVIGDCSMDGDLVRIGDGNLRTSQRTAFAAASKIGWKVEQKCPRNPGLLNLCPRPSSMWSHPASAPTATPSRSACRFPPAAATAA